MDWSLQQMCAKFQFYGTALAPKLKFSLWFLRNEHDKRGLLLSSSENDFQSSHRQVF